MEILPKQKKNENGIPNQIPHACKKTQLPQKPQKVIDSTNSLLPPATTGGKAPRFLIGWSPFPQLHLPPISPFD